MNTLTVAAGVLVVAALVLLGSKTAILRDASLSPDPPFSFARAQLMWWTLIVVLCFILFCSETGGALPAITESCLAVLGIGAGTTLTARIIDERHRVSAERTGTQLPRDGKSEGFLLDILSDGGGLSIHRLQALLFNVIFGAGFLLEFFASREFPVYDAEHYLLLGISSAGYLGLKSMENGEESARSKATAKADGADELVDPDEVADRPVVVG